MVIVYRKADKSVVFNSGKSYVTPEGISDINAKLSTIEKSGGNFEDYGVFRLHDIEDTLKVDEIITHQGFVNLVFESEEAVDYTVDIVGFEAKQVQTQLEKEEQERLEELKRLEELAKEQQLADLQAQMDLLVG